MRPDGQSRPDADGPVVAVAGGLLRGRFESGSPVYRGIPYARPPVGPLRFRPPVVPAPWHGIRDAGAFGPAAPQPADRGLYPGDPDAMPAVETAEDCLTLNVWAPAVPGPHPVLVWLHGGGQVLGGPARPIYDGSAFARKGIVCVTVGHRLGALGFLAHPDLADDDTAPVSNLALADQIAALAWVAANVAAFGGDPGRVTLGGESAGGKNVAMLLAAPAAAGLFHAAIVQSGGAETVHRPGEAQAVAETFAGLAGTAVHALRHLPVAGLLAAQGRLLAGEGRRFPFRPVSEQPLLPEDPLAAIGRGLAGARPLLVGTSRDEIGPTLAEGDLSAGWRDGMLAHRGGEAMRATEAAWRQGRRLPVVDRRRALVAAENYGVPAVRLADANAAAGAPTWMYRFDLPLPSGPLAGWVPHTADLAPSWGRPCRYGGLPGHPAARLHDVLVEFVHHHAAGWPRFDPGRRPTALFGAGVDVVDNPAGEMLELFGAGR